MFLSKHTVCVLLMMCLVTPPTATDFIPSGKICYSSENCTVIINTTSNDSSVLIQLGACFSSPCNETNFNLTCETSCEEENCSLPEPCPHLVNTECLDLCNRTVNFTTETLPHITTHIPDPVTTTGMTETTQFTTETQHPPSHTITQQTTSQSEGTTEGNRVHPDDIFVVIVFVAVIFLVFVILITYYFTKRARFCCFKPNDGPESNLINHVRFGGSADTLNSVRGSANDPKIRATNPVKRDESISKPTATETNIPSKEELTKNESTPETRDYKEISVAQLVASHPVHRGDDDVSTGDDSAISDRSRDGTSEAETKPEKKFIIIEEEKDEVIFAESGAGPKTPIKTQYSTVLDAVPTRRKSSRHNYQDVFKYPSLYSSLQSIKEAKVNRTSNYDSLVLGKTFANPYSPTIQPYADVGGVRSMSQGQGQSPGRRSNLEVNKRLSRTLDRRSMQGNNFQMTNMSLDAVFNENDERDFVNLRPRSADSVIRSHPRTIVESKSFDKNDDSDYEEL